MPKTYLPLIRYAIIDSLIRDDEKDLNLEQLTQETQAVLIDKNIVTEDEKPLSTETISKDIAHMKANYNAPIITKKINALGDLNKKYVNAYKYSDFTYSFLNQPITDTERKALVEISAILNRFIRSGRYPHLIGFKSVLNEINGEEEEAVVSTSSLENNVGNEYFAELQQYIEDKRPLIITYQPFGKEPIDFEFHPYHLRLYNNRWFCIGRNTSLENSEIAERYLIALDRIINLQESDSHYIASKTNWKKHFDDLVGVSLSFGAKKERVVLHFFGNQANYILTKPLHSSQKTKWIVPNQRLEVIIEVPLNVELENRIMERVDQIEIISPTSLQVKIKDRLKLALKRFE